MEKTISRNKRGNLLLVAAELTDGSFVYDVRIGNILINCVDKRDALDTFKYLCKKDLINQ
jgi:hypothetical protein